MTSTAAAVPPRPAQGMNLFERWLTLWVALCIVAGVALAVMQLVEAGRLDLDADINTYLPFKVVNPHHPNERITLRHLATHTSGM